MLQSPARFFAGFMIWCANLILRFVRTMSILFLRNLFYVFGLFLFKSSALGEVFYEKIEKPPQIRRNGKEFLPIDPIYGGSILDYLD